MSTYSIPLRRRPTRSDDPSGVQRQGESPVAQSLNRSRAGVTIAGIDELEFPNQVVEPLVDLEAQLHRTLK